MRLPDNDRRFVSSFDKWSVRIVREWAFPAGEGLAVAVRYEPLDPRVPRCPLNRGGGSLRLCRARRRLAVQTGAERFDGPVQNVTVSSLLQSEMLRCSREQALLSNRHPLSQHVERDIENDAVSRACLRKLASSDPRQTRFKDARNRESCVVGCCPLSLQMRQVMVDT